MMVQILGTGAEERKPKTRSFLSKQKGTAWGRAATNLLKLLRTKVNYLASGPGQGVR